MSETTTTPEISELEFDQYIDNKLRTMWTKVESIKNLLRNGQQVVAHEQLQGLSDGLAHLVHGVEKRIGVLGGDANASSSD